MKLNFSLSLTTILLLSITLPTEGKRITMFPLSARDVYRVLREAGREDAVPEGRIVTQGIAAVSGFALGLAKGIGGSLLVDLAIAGGLFGSIAAQQQVQTQEVCFSSRSLNEDYDGEDDDVPEGRQVTVTSPTAGTGASATGSTTPITTTLSSPTTSLTNAPTTTGTDTDTDNGSSVDNRDGTGTQSGTTTQTGTGGAINCVVIQQPPTTNNNVAG